MPPTARQAARLVVLDPDGALLLVGYRDDRGPWWATPGGGVEVGERLEDAARREAREELALAVTDLEPLWSREVEFTSNGQHIRQVEQFFLVRVRRDEVARGRELSADERRRAVIDHLVRLFGKEAASPIDYIDRDWTAEAWSRGCYVGIMPPRLMTRVGAALRAPVGRVHFAGTETATRWVGYLDGAIEAGERAAEAILDRRRGGE